MLTQFRDGGTHDDVTLLRSCLFSPLLVALAGCSASPPTPLVTQNVIATAASRETAPPAAPTVASFSPHPLRVVLAIEATGDPKTGAPVAASLESELTASLEAAGFKLAHQEGPAAIALLDKEKNPEEAARKIGAAFIVRVNLKPISLDASKRSARTEQTSFEVQKVGEDKPLPWFTTRSAGGTNDEECLVNLGQWLAETMVIRVLPYLVEHPSIQSVVQSKDERAAKLRTYLDAREKAITDFRRGRDEQFKKEEARVDMGAKMTLHHPGDAIESLNSTGPLGALVVGQTFEYFIPPRTMKVERVKPEYNLAWISLSGERKQMSRGPNQMQFISTAQDTERCVYVEQLSLAKPDSFAVVEPDKPLRRIKIDAFGILQGLKLSPGGKAVALISKSCEDCQNDLFVISVDDGSVLFRMNDKDYTRSGMVWLDARRLAVTETKTGFEPKMIGPGISEVDPQKLEIVDIAGKKPKVVLLAKNDQRTSFHRLAASRDGKKLFYSTKYGWYALMDVASRKVTPVYPGEDPDPNVVLSPDAKSLVYSTYDGVFLFEIATRQRRRLTKRATSSLPWFSHDGSRVYINFEFNDTNTGQQWVGFVGSMAVKDAGPPEVIDLPAPEPAFEPE